MRVQTKLVRDGNSWSVRLSKPLLKMSDIKPGAEVIIYASLGKIIVYSPEVAKRANQKDKYEIAKEDVRNSLNEAFEQAWMEIFGAEE